MYEEQFSQRLSELRHQKGISARDMSISLGQNPGYINTIEKGKSFPTMTNFFSICNYFDITPAEFFDVEANDPVRIRELTSQIKKLNEDQLYALETLVAALPTSK